MSARFCVTLHRDGLAATLMAATLWSPSGLSSSSARPHAESMGKTRQSSVFAPIGDECVLAVYVRRGVHPPRRSWLRRRRLGVRRQHGANEPPLHFSARGAG